VKKEKNGKNGKPGKPVNSYSLQKSFYVIAMADKSFSDRKASMLKSQYEKMTLSILMVGNSDDHYFLNKLLWAEEELLKKCLAINFLRSDHAKMELLLITNKLEEIRKKFSTIKIKDIHGNERKISCWSHSPEEIEGGLSNKDQYYVNLMRNFKVLYDPKNIMEGWKK